jgi:hypothetical protein
MATAVRRVEPMLLFFDDNCFYVYVAVVLCCLNARSSCDRCTCFRVFEHKLE